MEDNAENKTTVNAQDNTVGTVAENAAVQTKPIENGGAGSETNVINKVPEGLLSADKKAETPAEKDNPKKAAESEATPAEYEQFALAEGLVADPADMKSFTDFARAKGFTQAEAQSLIDIQNAVMKKSASKYHSEIQAQTDKLISGWEESVKADPEIGGAKLNENMAVARSAFKLLDVPEAEEVIMNSNLGSNPAILKLLFRAGQALGEAKYVHGSPSASQRSAAEVIYG